MSVIVLPPLPLPSTMDMGVKSNALDLTPQMGGPTIRVNRLGTRFNLKFNAREMNVTQALNYLSNLNQGLASPVRMSVPQPTFTYGVPGTPVVNGANQSGSSLALHGFTPGYVIQKGQLFSFSTAGNYYLHQVTTMETANGSGVVTVPIFPMLRISPADGDGCQFDTPQIQGWLDGNVQNWTLSAANSVSFSFSITEGQ
jgi:hypothetical protein